jgi:DNA-binding NtrC family response regulator
LRERREEIPIFIEYFLDKFSKKYEKKMNPISYKMMKAISHHQWLGNIRELENVIQRFVVLGDEEPIIEELDTVTKQNSSPKKKETAENIKTWPSLKKVHQEAALKAESEMILKALEMTNWNRKKAAHKLNVSYKTLLNKIKEFDLDHRFVPPRM